MADSQQERIARLEAQLAAMQEELALLKSQMARQPAPPQSPAVDEQAVADAVDKAIAARSAEPSGLPEWVSNVTLSGDFRYRHQWTNDRNRHMIQARIGLYGAVNDEIDVAFRLASGGSDSPTSNNQDLGDRFSSKNLWLDMAYADYHPSAVPGLNVYAGKMKNPYNSVGNSDLMLDTDVTPEGIAATYKTNLTHEIEVFGTMGGYYVEERALDADTSLWGAQGGATLRFGDDAKSHLTAGAGYYNYGNLKGKQGWGGGNQQFYGNTTVGPEGDRVFATDFDLVQGFAEVGVPVGSLPVRVFGDYIYNVRAASSRNTAYLVGATLGRASAPGSWAFGYNWRDVQADAILGVLAEATFAGGGTNIYGHKFTFDYQLAKNTQVGVFYMPAKRTRNNRTADIDVVMVDFRIKF